MRGIGQVFISLMRFPLCSFVSSSFLVLLKNSFLRFFFHLSMFNGVRFQYFKLFIGLLFSGRSDFVLIW